MVMSEISFCLFLFVNRLVVVPHPPTGNLQSFVTPRYCFETTGVVFPMSFIFPRMKTCIHG